MFVVCLRHGAELVCSCDRPQLSCDWVIYYTLALLWQSRVLWSGYTLRPRARYESWRLTEIIPDLEHLECRM